MAVDNEDVLEFAEKMQTDLVLDLEKKNWKKAKEQWWYFSQLVKNVNAMEDAMVANKDIAELPISISNYSLIISKLYSPKKAAAKKKATKKKAAKK